jgi:hypothetical protein
MYPPGMSYADRQTQILSIAGRLEGRFHFRRPLRAFLKAPQLACSGAINFVLIGYHFACYVRERATSAGWSTHANEHTGG